MGKKRNIKLFIFVLVTSLLIGCAGLIEKPELQTPYKIEKEAAGKAENGRYILKVVLYPYLPPGPSGNLQPMAERIESEFESAYPDIDLQILPINYTNDPYSTDNLIKWLGSPVTDSGVQIVEMDALMLDFVVNEKLVVSLNTVSFADDFHPAALSAVKIDEISYGVPHWMCGNFIISRFEEIAQSQTLDALGPLLKQNKLAPPYLSGNFRGSSTLPALYLGGWACTYGASGLQKALVEPLDTAVVSLLNQAASFCTDESSANPCIDFTYKDSNEPMIKFAQGQYDGYMGFSESMNTIAQQGVSSSEFYLGNFPFGNTETVALYYSDVFVVRKDCEGDCVKATTLFINYMIELKTFEWIVTTQDASTPTVPRYLIPSRMRVFDLPGIINDLYYQRIRVAISGNNTNFPNSGFLENKDRLNAELTKALNWPIK